MRELTAEVAVIGGGLGGIAAALGAAEQGARVIVTEESPWLGGQLTSQAVPPDEHPWMEQMPPTRNYARFRRLVRDYYRRNYQLSESARAEENLNPGNGSVSPLCFEPRVAVAAIDELLAPYRSDQQLQVLCEWRPVAAETDGDRVVSVTLEHQHSKEKIVLTAPYIIDATECGELLELAQIEHVYGAESRADTGELHAIDGPPEPANQQSFTWCFAMDYHPGADYTIDKPDEYEFWRSYTPGDFWPGPLLGTDDVNPITLQARTRPVFTHDQSWLGSREADFWTYRRIASVRQHIPGRYASDVTLVNWPQIDYMAGPILGVDEATRAKHLAESRQQSLSFLYWLQTESPRHDGGTGYRGLRPRGDLLGTVDGLALRPYIRESRRIKAEFTVTEQDVGVEARKAAGLAAGSALYADSVGVGSYRIDLHPATGNGSGPRNYIDISNYPFQVPLGSLLPQRVTNVLAGAKNLGVTHITNGCYRLHPVEWVIGEAAGRLAAHCLATGSTPHGVRNDTTALSDFQTLLTERGGFVLAWSDEIRCTER